MNAHSACHGGLLSLGKVNYFFGQMSETTLLIIHISLFVGPNKKLCRGA